MNLQDPAALVHVLSALCANDTNAIRAAEKELKNFAKTPACLPTIVKVLQECPAENIRHHAALLLKRRLGLLYSKCDKPQKAQLKDIVLTIVVNEPNKLVRVALCG